MLHCGPQALRMRSMRKRGVVGERTRFHPGRRIRTTGHAPDDMQLLERLAARVRYSGNPAHKRNPGDFDLVPPAAPRQGATLCDEAQVFRRADAEALLKRGIRAGLISERCEQEWPAQVWAVRDDGVVFEAQLENAEKGEYHGYPMPLGDPYRDIILRRAHGDG